MSDTKHIKLYFSIFFFVFTLQATSQSIYYIDTSHTKIGIVDIATCDTQIVFNSSIKIAGLTFNPNGKLYTCGMTGNTPLYEVNLNSQQLTYVGEFGPNKTRILTLASTCNGIIYTSADTGMYISTGNKATLETFNPETGVFKTLGYLPYHSGSALFFKDKTLYHIDEGHVIQIDTKSFQNSFAIGMELPHPVITKTAPGVVTIPYTCDSNVTIGIGFRNDVKFIPPFNFFTYYTYEFDFPNDTIYEICQWSGGVAAAHPLEFIASGCHLALFLDLVNRSGIGPFDYYSDTICSPFILEDILGCRLRLCTDSLHVDSVTITLSDGIQNAGQEYLSLPPTAGISALNNNSTQLTLIHTDNLSYDDIEDVIKAVNYNNDAAQPTAGIRTMTFQLWAEGDNSRVDTAFIPIVFSPPPIIDTVALCAGDMWNGQVYTNDTLLCNSFSLTYGCDSAHCTFIQIADTFYISDTAELCADDSLYFNNQWWQSDTVICATFMSSAGCDSTHCLYITLHDTFYTFQHVALCTGDTFFVGNNAITADTGFCTTYTAGNGCDSIHCISVSFLPAYSFSTYDTICTGEMYTWQGKNFTTDTIICYNWLTTDGCDSVYCLNLTVHPVHSDTMKADICIGDSIFFGGQWRKSPGLYSEKQFNIFGCDSTVYLQLAVYPLPIVSLGPDTQLCGNTITLDAGTHYMYQWSTGVSTPMIDISDSGIYSVTVSMQEGCTASDTIVVDVKTLSLFISAQGPMCPGEQNGFIVIDSVAHAAEPVLSGMNGNALQMVTAYQNLDAGQYVIMVEDADGCQASQVVILNAPTGLPNTEIPDVELTLGDSAALSLDFLSPFISSIFWQPSEWVSCDTCLDVFLKPPETTVYSISITDNSNCTYTWQVKATVHRDISVFVPTAFSPDGDGHNDFFTVFADARSVKKVNVLRVFDRWGSMVYQNVDMPVNATLQGWDGTFKGQVAPPGQYVYYAEIQLADGTEEVLKGGIVLVR